MLLYAIGCSMTYGQELPEDTREQEAWPAQLANLLDIDYFNDGTPAGSNDRITRKTMYWTAKYLKENKNPNELFVIAGWTSPCRHEYILDNNTWATVIPHSNYPDNYMRQIARTHLRHFTNEEMDAIKTYTQILSLQSWLKNRNIPYLFFSALHVRYKEYSTYIQPIFDFIDKKRYHMIENEDYCMFSQTRDYPYGPGLHPLTEGHKVWADKLAEYIKENGLLDV